MAKYALLRMRAQTPEAEPVTEVNIIPVIDISLVLLVILFVTAPLLSYPTLPVDLPPAHQPLNQDLTIAVTYAKDGALSVRAAPSSWDKLVPDLRGEVEKRRSSVVLLRVDREVPYRTVQRLIAAAKDSGAASIALATAPVKP
ncbi:MAG TPA: biopolymer transporter ExbD [Elusimicrobiota bacterium]|jgi:biopolymer transport protein ExbD|nr:biopolymer transporter ExbD [Elusimicrobiota bacterium]